MQRFKLDSNTLIPDDSGDLILYTEIIQREEALSELRYRVIEEIIVPIFKWIKARPYVIVIYGVALFLVVTQPIIIQIIK
jgi:hypothetical protein